jgi:hypothetical protein
LNDMSKRDVTRWLRLSMEFGDKWILPIYAQCNAAKDKGVLGELPDDIRSIGMSLSIRLNMLPLVVMRINKVAQELYKTSKNHEQEQVFDAHSEGYVFDVEPEIIRSLSVDTDALLFELNSCCELMSKFYAGMCRHIGGNPIEDDQVGTRIKGIIEREGQDSAWYAELNSHRNFFIHEGAPEIAVDISSDHDKYDVLIMKENLRSFSDKNKYFSLADLNIIVDGFIRAKEVLRKDLIYQIVQLGESER